MAPVAPLRAATTSRPAGGGRPRRRLTLNVEALAWVGVVAVAAGWRLLALGSTPPSGREALALRAAWDVGRGLSSDYPIWESTLGLAALLAHWGADSPAVLRLPAALFGVGSVAALALLRPWFGRGATLLTAGLLALSPIAAGSARTLTPDNAALFGALLLLWLVLLVGESGRWSLAPLLGLVGGLALGTGAIALAMVVVLLAWQAVEIGWQERAEVRARWRAAVAERGLWAAAVLLAVPGIGLSAIQFGAGPDRLALAAARDWLPLADATAEVARSWTDTLLVLPLYDQLILLLGAAGCLLLLRNWGRWTPTDRLLLIWLALALVLVGVRLHDRPGELLLLLTPLALLGGRGATRLAPTVLAALPRGGVGWLAATVSSIVVGVVTVALLSWAAGPGSETNLVSVVLLAGLIVVGATGAVIVVGRPVVASGGTLLLAVALLTTLRGLAGATVGDGDEPLRGERPLPARAAVVVAVRQGQVEGAGSAVERTLAADLAWELRGQRVREYVGEPPRAAVTVSEADGTAGGVGNVLIGRTWRPAGASLSAVARWLLSRQGAGQEWRWASIKRAP